MAHNEPVTLELVEAAWDAWQAAVEDLPRLARELGMYAEIDALGDGSPIASASKSVEVRGAQVTVEQLRHKFCALRDRWQSQERQKSEDATRALAESQANSAKWTMFATVAITFLTGIQACVAYQAYQTARTATSTPIQPTSTHTSGTHAATLP
jgi:hypothetical protein